MAQDLVLKKTVEPTWFNKEMAIGTLIAPVIGTFIGGWIGKRRMERERIQGKLVSSNPSFWNKDLLLGGLLGGVVGSIAAVLVPGTGLAMAVWLGGIALGGIMGGKTGQKRLEGEFEEARRQTIVRHVSQNVSPAVGAGMEYALAHKQDWAKDYVEDKMLADTQRRP